MYIWSSVYCDTSVVCWPKSDVACFCFWIWCLHTYLESSLDLIPEVCCQVSAWQRMKMNRCCYQLREKKETLDGQTERFHDDSVSVQRCVCEYFPLHSVADFIIKPTNYPYAFIVVVTSTFGLGAQNTLVRSAAGGHRQNKNELSLKIARTLCDSIQAEFLRGRGKFICTAYYHKLCLEGLQKSITSVSWHRGCK